MNQQRLAPAAVPTVAASAAATIREAIFDGRYAPGERLVESELSQQMGVSRGRYLRAKGLWSASSGAGSS